MPRVILTIPRSSVPENGVVGFEAAGLRGLVADVDGDLQAYSVVGPSARTADRAAVAGGRVLCPLHGWSIDPIDGRCGAGERCAFERLMVEVGAEQIRIVLPDR